MSAPNSLYLFLTVSQATTLLREARLPLSSLDALGDPYLSNHALMSEGPARRVTEAELEQELRRQYQALPAELSGLVSFEYFCEQAKGKRTALEAQILTRDNKPKIDALGEDQRQHLSLLRLYESAQNPALWEHQGRQFTSIAVELSLQDPSWNSPHYQGKPQLLRSVRYSVERPLVNPQERFACLFHRPEEYAAEREWRLLRPRSVADKEVNREGDVLFLHRIAPKLIRRLILGCNMPAAERRQLMSLLEHDLRYKHLQLQECRMDRYRYQIHLCDLNST